MTFPSTVRDFPVGEDAPQEAVAIPLDGVRDAIYLSRVKAESDDVHGYWRNPSHPT
jgi:hypothetical protein